MAHRAGELPRKRPRQSAIGKALTYDQSSGLRARRMDRLEPPDPGDLLASGFNGVQLAPEIPCGHGGPPYIRGERRGEEATTKFEPKRDDSSRACFAKAVFAGHGAR